MTDLGIVLESMSSVFNTPTSDNGAVVDLNDDKTLKWRNLLNNHNAKKKGEGGVSNMNVSASVTLESSKLETKSEEGQNNIFLKQGVEIEPLDNLKIDNNNIEKKEEENNHSPPKRTRTSEPSPSERCLRRAKPTELVQSQTSTTVARRRGRSKKITDNEIIDSSNDGAKKSRKNGKNVNVGVKAGDSLNNINDIIEKSNQEKKIEDIYSDNNAKKTRRSTRLEGKGDSDEILDNISKENGSSTTVEVKEDSKSPTELKNFNLIPEKTLTLSQNEKTPKKRGRRSKVSPNESNNTIQSSPDSTTDLTTISKKLPSNSKEANNSSILTSQRPLRRIKPTHKILENDELRYEFETKHIARITACTEMQTTELESTKIPTKKETTKDLPTTTLIEAQPTTLSDSHRTNSTSNNVKKKLFLKSNNNNGLTTTQPIPIPERRPCPDPVTFLNEIKAAKINLNRSPEDKKLNRKQQRRLLKQKEKHFEKLGLKRNIPDEISDSEVSSGEDEFVPSNSKKINVGKTNVTLRIRATNSKEGGGYVAIPGPSKIITPNKTDVNISSNTKNNSKTGQRKKRMQLHNSSEIIKTNLPEAQLITSPSNVTETIIPIETQRIEIEENLICLCQKTSPYYTRNVPDTSFCCAIDNIEEQKVGCCNQLSGELLNLLRPSQRVGYMILCEDHLKRLKAHNCCPNCGIFCTQGTFVLCQQKHFFHADCAQKFILNSPYDPSNTTDYTSPTLVLKCPHCGQDTPEKTSIVKMKCQTLPVFLPSQKALNKPAKMSVPDGQQVNQLPTRRLPVCVELENLIPESVMNVVVGRTNLQNSSNEFTSKDMFYAVNNDDLERVAEILVSGYDITSEMPELLNGTCLHLVAHFGTVQMAYLLLCRESTDEFLNMVDKELRTAIMCSIIGEKIDILKVFIQCGANLALKGPDGMTSLHIAAKLGNIEAAQLIVENHKKISNISAFEKFINSQDDGGWTAIVWAAELGFTEIVSLLLNNGANPNICDAENNSVLHWATLSNHVETISVLLRSNIDCSIQNINGDTPLHIACRSSRTRICLMLIANGADLMVKNKAEELPYDCISNEESQCARAVGFNMQMRSFGQSGLKNRIVCSDISNGRENHPIQVVKRDRRNDSSGAGSTASSEVDDIMIPDFKYITRSILLQNSIQIDYRVSQMRICSCNDGCNTDQCQCSTISIQNWYTPEGRLNGEFNFEDPAMIFECNDVCGCNKLMCKNRVVQNGIKIPLQVFECEDRLKGWGVRALLNIPRGSFVAEYTGEILTDLEADRRTDDSYFFDLGASEHCIDANFYGNVSRFFNHSCSPNIVPVRVYYEHQDYRFPKIAFFASKDISSGEELCFDYGDKFWSIKQKYFTCKCLLTQCRYSTLSSNIVLQPSATKGIV